MVVRNGPDSVEATEIVFVGVVSPFPGHDIKRGMRLLCPEQTTAKLVINLPGRFGVMGYKPRQVSGSPGHLPNNLTLWVQAREGGNVHRKAPAQSL